MLLRVSKDHIINTGAIVAVKARHGDTKVKVVINLMNEHTVELSYTPEKYARLIGALGVKDL